MATIGQVYDPIIAARHDPDEFERLLRETGSAIHAANPEVCPDAEDGYRAAKNNLEYYVQYCAGDIEREVKELLGVGNTFRTLGGFRIPDSRDAADRDTLPSPRM